MSLSIKLKSKDSSIYEVTENIAKQSGLLKNLLDLENIEQKGDNDVIPLYEVDSKTLELIIKWCSYHENDDDDAKFFNNGNKKNYNNDDELYYKTNNRKLSLWDQKFLNELQINTLINLINAANYLNIEHLLDISCNFIANSVIKGKSPEELRTIFQIEDDLSPEEKIRIEKENEWCQKV